MERVTAPIMCAWVVSGSEATIFFKTERYIILNHIDSFKKS